MGTCRDSTHGVLPCKRSFSSGLIWKNAPTRSLSRADRNKDDSMRAFMSSDCRIFLQRKHNHTYRIWYFGEMMSETNDTRRQQSNPNMLRCQRQTLCHSALPTCAQDEPFKRYIRQDNGSKRINSQEPTKPVNDSSTHQQDKLVH